MHKTLIILAFSIAVTGCMVAGGDISSEISSRATADPTPSDFSVCHGHGCTKVVPTALSQDQWGSVTRFLETAPSSAGDERRQLVLALAQMEKVVGEEVGTSQDLGGNMAGFGRKYQLDCVDEMTNTGTYLTMLDKEGLLRFHKPERRVTQSFFGRSFWTHTVATVKEIDSRQEFIIDTWVLDNGEVPYIMPIEDWDEGKELARVY